MQRDSARKTILVVDDEPEMIDLYRDLLEGSGYRIVAAMDGHEAKALLPDVRPDLVVLDLMLPDVDGLVLCSELKALLDVPIMICSATSRRRDAALGLHLGADDFVAKPFDRYDFGARVEAVLRRANHQPVTPAAAEPDHYRVGDLFIDRHRHFARLGNEELQLTPTEYRLLCTLASRPDEVLTRDQLAQLAWGYQDVTSGRSIDVHIHRLRSKLETSDMSSPAIVSVRGTGYKLVSSPRRDAMGVA